MLFWGITLCYIIRWSNDTGKFFTYESADFGCGGVFLGGKCISGVFLGITLYISGGGRMIPKNFFRPNRLIFAVGAYFGV